MQDEIKFTVKNLLKSIDRQTYSMVGYSPLREIIGSDSFTSIT